MEWIQDEHASTTSWGTPTGMRVYVPHGPCLSGSKRGQAKDGGIRSVPSNCRGSSSIAGTICVSFAR